MRVRRYLAVGAGLAAAVVVARLSGLWLGGWLFGSPTEPAELPAGPLSFRLEELTFGPVPEGEQVERELHVTNTSGETVTIERFEISCTCLGVSPDRNLVLGPGETRSFHVKLKTSLPNAKSADLTGLSPESVEVTAVHTTGDGKPPSRTSAVFRYGVQLTVVFQQPTIQIGVVSNRQQPRFGTDFRLYPPVTGVCVAPHSEWQATVAPAPGGGQRIEVIPTHPHAPRVVEDTIQVIPVTSDGEEKPARPLRLVGEVRSDVSPMPAILTFGDIAPGSSGEETFRLASLTERPFEVLDATCGAADVAVRRDTTLAHTYSVRVTSRAAGEQERKVVVRVRQDDGTEATVVIPVHYRGGAK